MGKMNIPKSSLDIFYNAKKSYDKAQININEFGEIVSHPRTGAPIENPYIKIREKSAKQMLDFRKQYKFFKEDDE
tara:strand:- start:52 stop:276 length:225 start_codon:yes stop_codon:yes gene_type:complete